MLSCKAFETLEQVEGTSSTKAKKSFLMEQADNNVLRSLLFWTYNPFYRFYIKKFEYDINDHIDESKYATHVFEFKRILSLLNARRVTGNNALDMVTKFFEKCDQVEQKWYCRVLVKDLRAGINTETINKVFPELIPIFPLALADKISDGIVIYPNRFRIEDKFDGYRCLTIVSDIAEMFSRNGNPLFGYDDILHEMSFMEKGYVYDGELISIASDTFKGMQKSAFKKTKGKKAIYRVFDIIPIKDFLNMTGWKPLEERLAKLDSVIAKCDGKLEYVRTVEPLFVGELKSMSDSDIEAADACFEEAISRGLEGVVVKDLDSLYMPGKAYSSACTDVKYYSWQKKKPRDLLDLRVVDTYEGTGENDGKLGGVMVEYNGSDGEMYLVGVGSGFNKKERDMYWRNKNKIVGKTIKVAADGETSNDNGGLSLRFPIFKGVRSDK